MDTEQEMRAVMLHAAAEAGSGEGHQGASSDDHTLPISYHGREVHAAVAYAEAILRRWRRTSRSRRPASS